MTGGRPPPKPTPRPRAATWKIVRDCNLQRILFVKSFPSIPNMNGVLCAVADIQLWSEGDVDDGPGARCAAESGGEARSERRVRARSSGVGRSRPQLKAWCNLCGDYKTCDRNNWRILFKDADERWKIPGEKGCWEVTAERSQKYPPSTSTCTSSQEEL